MSRNHVISEKVLEKTIALILKHDEGIKLAERFIAGHKQHQRQLKEFVRANWSGDRAGFDVLKEAIVAGKGHGQSHYTNPRDRLFDQAKADAATIRAYREARDYINAKEESCPINESSSTSLS